MREIKVNSKFDGKKVTNLILNEFPRLSLNVLNKAYRKKDIRINGNKISKNMVVHVGDIVSIYITDEYLLNLPKYNIQEMIVYEDENILILNKPSDICVTKENEKEVSLMDLCEEYNPDIQPVHRLDRNTKGLVVFSKNENSYQELLQCFKDRLIEKYYKCLVLGIPQEKEKLLTAYLFKDSKNNIVNISNTKKKGYEEIKTYYKVLECRNDNTSILEVNLLTGKTHQIRAHLASIGHPIIGDGKYGIGEINKKFKKNTQELYAYKLVFNTKNLPNLAYLDGKTIEIECKI